MSKTIYYANHEKVKGYELVRVEEAIDILGNVSFWVILDSIYNHEDGDRFEYCIGSFDNIKEAVDLADNYTTLEN